MSLLSAASMESYSRAYPLLTRLHILQEIESGNRLINQSDINNITYNALNLSRKNSENILSKFIRDKDKLKELHWEERLQLMTPSFRERSTTLAVRRCILGEIKGRHQIIPFLLCIAFWGLYNSEQTFYPTHHVNLPSNSSPRIVLYSDPSDCT